MTSIALPAPSPLRLPRWRLPWERTKDDVYVPAIGTPTNAGTGFVSSATTTVTITGVTASVGDLLIVDAGNDGGAVPSAVSDPAGNSWSSDITGIIIANEWAIGQFSTVVTNALAAATLTITFAGIVGTWDKFAACAKVTGSWDSSRVDQKSSANGTGTAWDSANTPTTAVAAELVYGGTAAQVAGIAGSTPGASLSELHDVAASAVIKYSTVYRVTVATGAYKANGTFAGTSTPWGAVVVTYKEAATGGSVRRAISVSREAQRRASRW